MRVYKEVTNLEKALIKQIVQAINAEYLKALRNSTNNTITLQIINLLTYLFNMYRYVAPSKVEIVEQKLKTLYWNPYNPLVLLYNSIEDFKSLAEEATNLPHPPALIINYSISII